MTRLSLLFALLLAGASLPLADATIDICSIPAETTAPFPVTGLLLASGPTAYMDGSCSGQGIVGGGWPGLAACGAPGVYVVQSTYCGVEVQAGQSVKCTWVGSSGNVHGIAVGFDINGDGHIFAPMDGPHSWRVPQSTPRIEIGLPVDDLFGGPLVPVLGSGTYIVTNHGYGAGRVVAYPMTTGHIQGTAAAHIGCAL